MKELLDGDLASNNGGWQWSASTGTDAQPWFRIFNPVLQGMKFDPHGKYVKTWCPELSRIPENHVHAPWEAPPDVLAAAGVRLGGDYPRPCVDHSMARVRAIARFEAAVKSGSGRPGNRK
jgi:deoxyribodipyrimidine photo-lyase